MSFKDIKINIYFFIFMFFQNEAGKCLFSFLKYEIFDKKKSNYAHYDVTPPLFSVLARKWRIWAGIFLKICPLEGYKITNVWSFRHISVMMRFLLIKLLCCNFDVNTRDLWILWFAAFSIFAANPIICES